MCGVITGLNYLHFLFRGQMQLAPFVAGDQLNAAGVIGEFPAD